MNQMGKFSKAVLTMKERENKVLSQEDERFIRKIKTGQKLTLILIPVISILFIFWMFYFQNIINDKFNFYATMIESGKKMVNIQPKTELEAKLKDILLDRLDFETSVMKLFKLTIVIFVSIGLFSACFYCLLSYVEYKKFLAIIEKSRTA